MLLHILDRRPLQEKLQRLIEHGIVEREKMPDSNEKQLKTDPHPLVAAQVQELMKKSAL
ncbi:MAG: hypothetical protein HEQ33_10055 [Dolichospermum sp. WA123]|nr:hypothetical protein [Dolichospermum sp. WA123]